MQNNTIFGKIIRGEIPCTKVYEDENFIAFLDINPVSKGHTLLMPKEHFVWIQDVPDKLLGDTFIKVKELILAIKTSLGCDFVQVLVEGKDVPHFHVHLIPGYLDRKSATWEHVAYEDGERAAVAEKIRSNL
jgi:histidine triad (HIT) family protein